MPGEWKILFSLAGRMHVLLRREINRIIDVEWMCIDPAYARRSHQAGTHRRVGGVAQAGARIEEVHPKMFRIEHPVDSVSQPGGIEIRIDFALITRSRALPTRGVRMPCYTPDELDRTLRENTLLENWRSASIRFDSADCVDMLKPRYRSSSQSDMRTAWAASPKS